MEFVTERNFWRLFRCPLQIQYKSFVFEGFWANKKGYETLLYQRFVSLPFPSIRGLITRTGIEPVTPPWEGDVLTNLTSGHKFIYYLTEW